jgi:hypothetical protein
MMADMFEGHGVSLGFAKLDRIQLGGTTGQLLLEEPAPLNTVSHMSIVVASPVDLFKTPVFPLLAHLGPSFRVGSISHLLCPSLSPRSPVACGARLARFIGAALPMLRGSQGGSHISSPPHLKRWAERGSGSSEMES